MDHSRHSPRAGLEWAILLASLPLAFLLVAEPAAAQQPDSTKKLTFQPGTMQLAGHRLAVDVGVLRVPELRGSTAGRTLTLRVVRFESTAPDPGSPILFLPGGPGESGIGAVEGSLGSLILALRQAGDVIALEPRGTGDAADSLFCRFEHHLPLDRPGNPDLYRERMLERTASCVELMRHRGVALAGYTVQAAAEDVEDVRKAVHAERLTVWAIGSGTQVALAVARQYPASVDRMILAGVQGPDRTQSLPSAADAVLDSVGRLAAADPAYAGYPDLPGALHQILDRLGRDPVRVDVLPKRHVVVGRWDLQKRLADAIESRSELERIPAAVVAMSRNDFSELGLWAYGFRRTTGWSAAALARKCASYPSPERLEHLADTASVSLVGAAPEYPAADVCRVPGLPRLDEAFRTPFRSTIPTLLISGALDGRAPAQNAAEVTRGFAVSNQLILDNATHADVLTASAELAEPILAFARGEEIRDTVLDGPAWHFVRRYPRSLEAEVLRRLSRDRYAATVDWYHEQRRTRDARPVYDFDERVLNTLGYELLRADETDLALLVFHLNAEGYPGAFNTWDSLGEAYLVAGDTVRAIRNYRKSLALNPRNGNARAILSRLQRKAPGAERRRR